MPPEDSVVHLPHGRAALRGALLALGAALLFGFSTPLVQQFGHRIGSFSTAALLYAGAALTGWLQRKPLAQEAQLRLREDGLRLLGMALCGALLGPVALAWGLQHTSGSSASLMLTLEAVFTAVLAWIFYREALDRRVQLALLLLTLGGMALVIGQRAAGAGQGQWLGLLAVMLATVAWGADNTLSRAMSARDPAQVVLFKACLGASVALGIAGLLREPVPPLGQAFGLVLVGGTGYGLSLRLYLLAQRSFGAARTASVFAFAPFAGAALAWSLGQPGGGLWAWLGSLLMLAGLWLHLTEDHAHEHSHEALEHEHAHRHDDGHHDHEHEPGCLPVTGTHSHPHRHRPVHHAHAHVPDAHHLHRHEP